MKEQTKSFGELNFGHAELGDVRRTRRPVELADRMAEVAWWNASGKIQ